MTKTEPSVLDMTTRQAYRHGFELRDYYSRRLALDEIAEALASWRAAADDHGHASYYGVFELRAMRAYWLGVARRRRQLDESGRGWCRPLDDETREQGRRAMSAARYGDEAWRVV
jgi:hypothetical protein